MCQLHYWNQAEQQFRGTCLTLLKVSLQGSWILSSLQARIYAKISKKRESFFFNTSSAFQCVYHRFQVYCHTLSNNLDKFPKELGGKLGIYQWIFKFQEDMELETEMTWFSKMRAVNHFSLDRIHASRWELANLLKPGSDCCSPSLPPGWIAGYSDSTNQFR